MIAFLEKVRLFFWKIGQPLTRIPTCPNATVSDLFIWRNTENLTTYFELLSLPFILDEIFTTPIFATLVIFNRHGEFLSEETIQLMPTLRQTISLSDYLPDNCGSYGTFSIFHPCELRTFDLYDSFIAERGYVAYKLKSMPLCSFVHGNLDALARYEDKSMHLLGSTSFRKRIYNLQFCLNKSYDYEFAIVNSSNTLQKIQFSVSTPSSVTVHIDTVSLMPRACHIFCFSPSNNQSLATFTSNLVMARPLVFKLQGNLIDSFHG